VKTNETKQQRQVRNLKHLLRWSTEAQRELHSALKVEYVGRTYNKEGRMFDIYRSFTTATRLIVN
jgi:hypothetical protein